MKLLTLSVAVLIFATYRVSAFSIRPSLALSSQRYLYTKLYSTPDDDEALVPVRRRRTRTTLDPEDYYETDDDQYYYSEEFYQDLEDAIEDDWDIDLEPNHDLFGNEIIPNPLLDSIDPDGAAERFPELARDPKFWLDMALFLAFLAFLSDIGPRDTLPDIPLF